MIFAGFLLTVSWLELEDGSYGGKTIYLASKFSGENIG